MKLVTFEVAKAIKEAGYPQFSGCHYYNCDGVRFVNPEEGTLEEDDYYAPTYLDLWLWLWREKKISIDVEHLHGNFWGSFVFGMWTQIKDDNIEFNDPEEAIVAAIDYLVEHNLIK